ncbi:MAG: lantibiotic dehydratase [Actinomycetota bacterium]|nr:lantibiotic dehydratase [Actinomycetota bacterium]
MATGFGMVRAALLSVDEAAALVASGEPPDGVTRMAVDLAWGSPVDGSSRPDERPLATTLRYIARMGGRATPFGLLAGTQHVEIGSRRRLTVGARDQHKVLARIDFEALQTVLVEAMDEAGLERWPVRRNRTLRVVGGQLRYTKAGDATADMVNLRPTPAIKAVLDAVGEKTVLVAEVLDTLEASFPGTPRDALLGFVGKLVDNDLLRRAVDLIKPGEEPAELALETLDRIGDRRRASTLAALTSEIAGDHWVTPAVAGRLDQAWQTAAAHLPTLAQTPSNRRYHLDLELSMSEATLDERTVSDLVDAVRRLELLLGRPTYLAGFHDVFRRQYEDTEVPLLEAVDLETGALRVNAREMSTLAQFAGVRIPHHQAEVQVPTGVLDVLDRWTRGTTSVDLQDLPRAEHNTARGLFAAVLDDSGPFHSLLFAGYQRTHMALLGRFAFGRKARCERLRRWQDETSVGTGMPVDQSPTDIDAPIHAELVYSPGNRFGNVLLRPRLYQETIALEGGGDGSLSLDRLLVRLEGDTVRLRDAVSGRDVVVEMNTPHNVTAESLDPIYSFLGLLVSPGAIGWSWGSLARLSHLPRLTCGRVIVAPEQWNVTGADIKQVLAAADPATQLRRLLDGFDDRRWIGVGEDDRLLPVDLSSPRSILVGLARSAHAEQVRLTELPHVEHPAMAGPTGRHVTEIVVPLRPAVAPKRRSRRAARQDPAAGARWVYFKYYCGPSTADTVIGEANQLARDMVGTESVGDWFFVRYRDDGYHVRVRMRPARPDHRAHVVAAMDELGSRLQRSGLVSRIVMDTYVPEVTRYGGVRSLPFAESLFTADSSAVAALVAAGPVELERLFQAVADMAHWCSTVFTSYDEQHQFVKQCASGLGMHFARTGNLHGRFYRAQRQRIEDRVASTVPDPTVTARLIELAGTVRRTSAGDGDPNRVARVIGSALHMHCNRLFSVDARRLEFLAYDIAGRRIRERRARAAG